MKTNQNRVLNYPEKNEEVVSITDPDQELLY